MDNANERGYGAAITDFQKRCRDQWLLCMPLLLVGAVGAVFCILYRLTNLIGEQVAFGILIGLLVGVIAAGIPAAYGQIQVHEWRCPRCEKSPWDQYWAKPLRVYLFASYQRCCPNCGLSFVAADVGRQSTASTMSGTAGRDVGGGPPGVEVAPKLVSQVSTSLHAAPAGRRRGADVCFSASGRWHGGWHALRYSEGRAEAPKISPFAAGRTGEYPGLHASR
jgi:hypothetical protein